jgi:hypothetical protein
VLHLITVNAIQIHYEVKELSGKLKWFKFGLITTNKTKIHSLGYAGTIL